MARDALVEHCLELLAPLGAARSRRMFGAHGLYLDDLFIAVFARQTLYLKVTEASRPLYEAAGSHPFVYDVKGQAVAMGYWSVPADAMESTALMAPWARLAVQAALAARAAKVKRKPAAVPARRATVPARRGAGRQPR